MKWKNYSSLKMKVNRAEPYFEEIKESVRKNIENETFIKNINKCKLADEMEKLLISKNENK